MTFLLSFPLLVVALIVLFVLSRRLGRQRRDIDALAQRIAALEHGTSAAPPTAHEPSSPAVASAPPSKPSAAPTSPPPTSPPPGRAAHEPARPPIAPPRAGAASSAARRADAEQWVGAVGLQNVGSVLLLVGFFFLVLWGYSTGRFGPLVLVVAGVLAGIGVAWRGDRLRRTVRGLGDALLGVGSGIVWLALYLGWTTLHALQSAEALPLLFAASVLTGALGLRYRVEGISALGLIGAFLPHLLRFVVTLPPTPLSPWGLLGYLASINLLVFALAWRSGWSRLALASVLLTAVAWSSAVSTDHWSWALQVALTVLFLALGATPLPRLVGIEGRVRPVDLALIAAAPVAMLAASWPMFALARAVDVAMLLGSLAVVYFLIALAVDRRRPERDLWRPLTAAATLFLTVALERSVGPENTGLAWAVEGVVLAWLGLAPRSAWLRTCGSAVAFAAACRLLPAMFTGLPGEHPVPLVHPQAVREAVAIAALLFGAWRLERAAGGLGERWVAHGWLAGAHLLLACWLVRESHHLAWALEGPSGMWRALPDVRAASGTTRYLEMFTTVAGLALVAQATWLAGSGARDGRRFARVLGHGLGMLAMLLLAESMRAVDGWGRDLPPLVHRDALAALGAVLLAMLCSAQLARRRGTLSAFDRRSPEVWAASAAFVMLFWLGREADHLARVMLGASGPNTDAWHHEPSDLRERVLSLGSILASVGWLAQAVVVFALGWWRRSAFLRWMALALLGLTLLKFVLVDLAHADPFWRFLTALLAGAAMLVLSFVYQRLGSGRTGAASQPDAANPGPPGPVQ